jgi:oxygen-independent coproporphyrinogen-3 oxidase
MLPASEHLRTTGVDSLRFSTTDSLDRYLTACEIRVGPVTAAQAVEESFFLGLRLNRGVSLDQTTQNFGVAVAKFEPVIEDLVADGLLDRRESTLRLTLRGRLLSNDVFEKFIS